MRQFPVILIPPEVQRIAQSKPVAPELNIPLPSPPPNQLPAPIQIQEAIALSFGLIAIVAIVTLVAKELGIILLILGTVVIVLRIRYQFLTYKRRYQSHQNVLQNYFTKLEAYSREEVSYQQKLAIAHAPERVLEFRHHQFQKFFAKLPPIENTSILTNPAGLKLPSGQAPQAIAETIYNFGVTLQKHLSGTLYQGCQQYIPSIDYHWAPALTYVNPELNARIAIEIANSSESAASLTQNDLVDRSLVGSGWIIIKFAQEQIRQSPASCGKEFAKLLDRLSFEPSVLEDFRDIPDLVPLKR